MFPINRKCRHLKNGMREPLKVMYWLSISISNSMIVHIQDASTPKEAWITLANIYSTNKQAMKMQLKQELHNV